MASWAKWQGRTGWPLVAAVMLVAGPVLAQSAAPVALVEDVGQGITQIEAWDSLTAGTVLRLPRGGVVTLGYFRSCVRELITGGTVTIGQDRSEVQGGTVAREVVPCNTGRQQADQARPGGVAVFRGTPQPNAARVDVLLHATVPLVEMGAPGPLTIDRLDQAVARISLQVPASALRRGWFDFARTGESLTPGATYRFTTARGQLVVRVDPNAGPPRSTLSRMVRFGTTE